jgi:hypothetical protein
MLELKRVAVAEIGPNPYRDVAHYPLIGEKLAALKASMEKTGFWENLEVRLATKGSKFKYEIPYGHHRLEVLKQLGITHIHVIVRDLSNAAMLQKMAFENMQEFGHSASGEQQIVSAVIEAYARGEIELPEPNTKTSHNQLRFAPSYVIGDATDPAPSHPYTLDTLTEFLGWARLHRDQTYKVEAAVLALGLIEDGIANAETYVGLSSQQARSVSKEGRRIRNATKDPKKAAAVVRDLAAGMRKGSSKPSGSSRAVKEVTVHSARRIANKLAQISDAEKLPPGIERFIETLVISIGRVLADREEKLEAVVKFRDDLPKESRKLLIGACNKAIKEFTILRDKLDGEGSASYHVSPQMKSLTDQR